MQGMARWRGGRFLMTPEQHRALVAIHGDRPTRSGNLLVSELARHRDQLARAIERRMATGPVSFAPPHVASPPLAPQ
jgi:hypothetical protein